MRFELTILGCNSALPANNRFPTSQVLNIQEEYFLIDCGEGTQIQMNKYHIKRSKINHIFISHLHGDHMLGLPGLLNSFSLKGRTKTLKIFSPKGLEEIIEVQMRFAHAHFSYPIEFHVVDPTIHQLIFENHFVSVYSVPLNHRIPTSGYLFKEKQHQKRIKPEKIQELNIPYQEINGIKNGADWINKEGEVFENDNLTFPAAKARSYAYCSDTVYKEDICPMIENVDMLYHETTFCHDQLERAVFTKHTTALQAATIAQKSKAKLLITGHYSSRYVDLSPILNEAQSVFSNTVLGEEGKLYAVPFE